MSEQQNDDDSANETSSESSKDRDGKVGHSAAPRYSSIQIGPNTLNTIAGPINEWLPVPENMPAHPTMAFFGKRRTGKSTTITNLLFHCFGDIPFGMVMSGTAFAGYWEQIVPKQFIVQGLRQDVLDWLVQRQKKAVSTYGIKDPRIRAFIVLDDVIADQKTIRYNADLASFFVEGYVVLPRRSLRAASSRRDLCACACTAFPLAFATARFDRVLCQVWQVLQR